MTQKLSVHRGNSLGINSRIESKFRSFESILFHGGFLDPLAPELLYFFLILAHSVYKM